MNGLIGMNTRNGKKGSRLIRTAFIFLLLISIIITSVIKCTYIPVSASVLNPVDAVVWELILTLLTSSGAAPVNSAVNAAGMNSALGSITVEAIQEGTYGAAAIDDAVSALVGSSDSASQVAGAIAESFATSAADAGSMANAISAAGGVEGVSAASGAMSAGENLVNVANVAASGGGVTAGVLGVNLTGAGAVAAAAVAPIAGVGIGFLLANFGNKVGGAIKNGIALNDWNSTISGIAQTGGQFIKRVNTSSEYFAALPAGSVCGKAPSSSSTNPYTYYVYSKNNNATVNVAHKSQSGKFYTDSSVVINNDLKDIDNISTGWYWKSLTLGSGYVSDSGNFISINNVKDAIPYLIGIDNGTEQIPNAISPDVITPDGNAQFDNNNNTFNFNPTYNTNNQYVSNPISYNDYQNFQNTTNNNTENNNYIDNGDVINNFMNNYVSAIPTLPVIPDPQPTVPTPTPNTPVQDEQASGYMVPTGIKDIFPFCIPWDIKLLFTKFNSNSRSAPNFTVNLPLGDTGIHTITVDLSMWDDVAALFRTLELLLFILLLMLGTRKLIGD